MAYKYSYSHIRGLITPLITTHEPPSEGGSSRPGGLREGLGLTLATTLGLGSFSHPPS